MVIILSTLSMRSEARISISIIIRSLVILSTLVRGWRRSLGVARRVPPAGERCYYSATVVTLCLPHPRARSSIYMYKNDVGPMYSHSNFFFFASKAS